MLVRLIAPLCATLFISIIPIGILLLIPNVVTLTPRRRGGSSTTDIPLVNNKVTNLMLCFAAGSLVGDSLLNLLVHSMFGDFPSIENTHKQAFSTVVGITVFFIIDSFMKLLYSGDNGCCGRKTDYDELELPAAQQSLLLGPPMTSDLRRKRANAIPSPNLKMLRTGHISPSPERAHHSGVRAAGGILNLIADAIHNFTDGLAISTAFTKDIKFGITTTIAIFLHEIPHELGDYAILSKFGYRHSKIIGFQCLTAAASLLGAIFGAAIHSGKLRIFFLADPNVLLPFSAGGFLYVALCNLLPEVLNDEKTPRTLATTLQQLMAFFVGIALMYLIE